MKAYALRFHPSLPHSFPRLYWLFSLLLLSCILSNSFSQFTLSSPHRHLNQKFLNCSWESTPHSLSLLAFTPSSPQSYLLHHSNLSTLLTRVQFLLQTPPWKMPLLSSHPIHCRQNPSRNFHQIPVWLQFCQILFSFWRVSLWTFHTILYWSWNTPFLGS